MHHPTRLIGSFTALAAIILVTLPLAARGQSISPAIYLDVDTSGTMLLSPAGAKCYGDGSVEHPHYGSCVSRIYMAKNAITTSVNGYPEVRWGLARFKQNYGSKYVCICETQTDVHASEEPDACEPWTTSLTYDLPIGSDPVCINYCGGFGGSCGAGIYCCDPSQPSVDMAGADILVALAEDNEQRILPWLDHRETQFRTGLEPATGDHCWSGTTFGDCELRAVGGTPIAGSLRDLYTQLSNNDLGDDPQRGCRPYQVILLTDGDESCENPANAQAQAEAAAAALLRTPDLQHTCGAGCPPNSTCVNGRCEYQIKTYVIAFALTSSVNADGIAAAGGTGASIPAFDENDISAAMAQIISESLVAERCNGQDDDCDGEVDEDFPLGQACDNGGIGICRATGTYQCDPGDDTTVRCQLSTSPPQPGTVSETCNGLDDDCDGEVDEGGVCTCHGPELCNGVDDYCNGYGTLAEGAEDPRVGQTCGTDVGACTRGATYCGPGGTILCSGIAATAEVCDANTEANDQNCNGVNNDGIAPQACQSSNAYGTCNGLKTCDPDGNWICWARTPAAEDCNGIDDDCDGQVDENLSRTCQVTNANGTCSGTQGCTGGAWTTCSAATPQAELCNGLDDNCNGQIDENLQRTCTRSNTFGTCSGVEVCTAGGWGTCTAATAQAETCNGLDDDCDGLIDEGLTQSCYTGPAGTAGQGLCHAGNRICTLGVWGACQGQLTPAAEICDGLDNDCDGATDEDLGSTTCGLGRCQHTVQNCVGGVPQACDPFWNSATESCNGQDDDCDGVADGLGRACYPFASGCTETSPGVFACQGVCSTGLDVCPMGSGAWSGCQFATGPQPEICDGVDNDCDGQIDEDDLGAPLSEVCYSPGSGALTGCQYDPGSGAWSCRGVCQTGTRVCTGGAMGACSGELAPSLEQCNGLDDDCDGEVDELSDIPGIGEPCGVQIGRCLPGLLRCEGGVPSCEGGQGPFPGTCNGLDDDCDGEVDEADEVAAEEGLACGNTSGLCTAGATRCLGGAIVCEGGVQPTEEVCDGEDNDCDGVADDGAPCPAEFFCVQGDCRPVCDPTAEFPCPGSLSCLESTVDGTPVHVCLPEDCGGETCPAGWDCVDDACVDPCNPSTCEWWQTCQRGECIDTTCSGIGHHCPEDQFCLDHACVADPCVDASCAALGRYCHRICDGPVCSAVCDPLCLCPGGERCQENGTCAADPCAASPCGAGQRCVVATGECEADPCAGRFCARGEACFEGACVPDPCALVDCPAYFVCEVQADTSGQGAATPRPLCRADDRYWVPGQGVVDRAVTTGGRGGCQTSPEPGAGSWLLVVLVLGVALARRRRARALSVLPLLALFPLAAGCEVTDYHYQTGDPGHYRFPDAGPPTDAQGLDVEAVDACVATPEACDGEDNDCNGVIDDVAQATLDVDPQNCGACGWRCEVDFAFPGCAAGECTVGTCFPGHHDLNGIPDDGCEYACSPTNGGIERCDGMDNDCNGLADETIDLDTDATNCGECGHVCMFYQATGACSGGQCELFSCRGGFVDRDGNGDNGCECQMTLTEGSVTCDPAAPACGAAEVCADVDGDAQSHCSAIPLDLCDGEDNDCDGQVDEDAETQLSDSACYTYPLGCSETAPGVWSCAGQCRTGLEQCVGGRIRCSGEVTPSAEVCDGVDNNCDGQVDEGYDVQSDLRNCGTCGNVCPLQAGANSYAVACAAGQCQFACQPNHHDLDGDVATGSAGTGCEYACIRSNGGVEACGDSQDNDCDGQVDEGFLLATDPNNCGTCGNSCAAGTPIHAVAQGCSGGTCQYSCEVGWNDTNGDRPLGLAGNGCEYACTPSNGGVEACDDLDNDCDGQIDEDFFKETNPLNCGACGYQCSAHLGAHAVVLGCSGGVCRFGCAAGWVDLNGDVALGSNGNGCEYACTPSNGGVEICDTLDNDCDGKTDEGADGAPLAQTCYSGAAGTAGVGTCRSGARLCTGGAYGACLGEVVPQAELCDGLDNDCNGQVDNGISTASDINNCGACGQSCWASLGANAYPSACVAGVCQLSCLPGFSDLNNDRALGTGGDGCEYTCPVYPPTTEYCDGRDNDCDGQIDEGVTPPPGICYAGVDGPGPAAPGTAANNPCRNVTALCQDPDGAGPQPHAWYCQYPAAVERDPANPNALRGYELLCDGQDGDCDGTPDDGFGVGQSCDDGEIGACRSTGHFQCKADHLGSECHLEVAGADPANEQCDGLDNDCDGLVDESQLENVPGNEPAGITQGFVVDEVVDITTPGGLVVSVYLYEASHPTATATDGGIGTQSRSCSRPDVIPWSFVTYQQAARACALAGRRLCRPAEWYEACNGTPGSSLYPYGNTYQPASCNGHDADAAKDAVEPTGWQSDCASNGWDIEDLSGNLREWTTDFVGVTVDGRKVFRLRGGSYLDLQAGLACDFGNSAYVEDSAAAHVGFRCCSTCGNGTVDPGELCDPALTPATCHPLHCGPLTCGNGVREGSEQCDDGNLEPADGCSPACLTEVYCGDGVKATSEQCDDGNGTPFDGCSPLCTNETIVQPTVNFQTCPPTGWTIVNEGGTIVWDCQNNGNENGTGSPSGQKYIRAYSSGTATARTALVTSAYNFSTRTAVRLSFYYYYNESPVPSAPRGLLQYSTNGTAGPWTTIETIADPITAARWVKDVSAYVAGHASVAFRFYFEDLSTTDGASGLFQIDDVEIRAY